MVKVTNFNGKKMKNTRYILPSLTIIGNWRKLLSL